MIVIESKSLYRHIYQNDLNAPPFVVPTQTKKHCFDEQRENALYFDE